MLGCPQYIQWLNINDSFIPQKVHRSRGGIVKEKYKYIYNLFFSSKIKDSKLLKSIIPEYIRHLIRNRINSITTYKPIMKKKEKHFLKNIYQNDIYKLESLIERDLSNWTQ